MSAPAFPLRIVRRDDSDVSRRTFLKLLGATAIAAGAACAKPAGEIVPYVTQPPELVPGVPLHFATAMELDGYATGLLVASREGRPVKIEGNPDHPASLGSSGVFHQAALLDLYDPDRPEYIHHTGASASWADCAAAFSASELRRIAGDAGAGLFFLLEPTASPLVLALADRVHQRFPAASFCYYAPLATPFVNEGLQTVFGSALQPLLDLRHADVVLAVDDNLLAEGPFQLRYARQFSDGRRVRTRGDRMNRLYVVESAFTPTGAAADHRLAVRPSEMVGVLAVLLEQVLSSAAAGGRPEIAAQLRRLGSSAHADWAREVGRDLVAHHGAAVVTVGSRQPAIAHVLGAALNEALGAAGGPVTYVDPLLGHGTSLQQLTGAMRAAQARALVIIGGNPSYTAPALLNFRELVRQVPLSLYAGLHHNETAQDAQWFVPLAHFLESWGDARALDGTTSIVQPLIAPLHGGRSAAEILAFFAGDERPPDDLVRSFWLAPERLHGDMDAWRDALRRGIVPGGALTPATAAVRWNAVTAALAALEPPARPPVEIAFVPDASVYDGRFANNAWLQEMPDPITKLTWDNAAYMSHATLDAAGADESQVLQLAANDRALQAPAFVVPGLVDGLVVLSFGYGRSGNESVASGVGANAYELWNGSAFSAGVSVKPALTLGMHSSHSFAVTALHWSLEGRPVVLEADLDRFNTDPSFSVDERQREPGFYEPKGDSPRQWGMAIDLTVCTGCSACVVACQAENNVPIVGKLGVEERREMHWLRIDRYLSGSAAHPRLNMQPMLCQHCEEAPCEYVCPVNATVHSPDGLNEMVYNRCVGTRFCSNNCPYKVRRFNFLNYTQELPETEQMAMNPDVTVRARGVMEKCTFCVQRIRRADIDADTSGSNQAYARLQTACQQACPTRAIVFGSIADSSSEVARTARSEHGYHVLNELGTRPRITYLARLRNANPALPEERT